jgi:hypothetical protein
MAVREPEDEEALAAMMRAIGRAHLYYFHQNREIIC